MSGRGELRAGIARAKLPESIGIRFRELGTTVRLPQPAIGAIELGDLVLAP